MRELFACILSLLSLSLSIPLTPSFYQRQWKTPLCLKLFLRLLASPRLGSTRRAVLVSPTSIHPSTNRFFGNPPPTPSIAPSSSTQPVTSSKHPPVPSRPFSPTPPPRPARRSVSSPLPPALSPLVPQLTPCLNPNSKPKRSTRSSPESSKLRSPTSRGSNGARRRCRGRRCRWIREGWQLLRRSSMHRRSRLGEYIAT